MKNKYLALILILVLFLSFTVTTTTWKLDSVHSNLGFSILHLGVSNVKGTVKLNSATISVANEDFSDCSIVLEADMKSIDTDNDNRDAHLKSADFFDTEKFPSVNFQSTSFKKGDQGNYELLGNLTLHGNTKPVRLTAVVKTGINPTNNKPVTGIKVTGVIKRSEFDISTGTPEAILSDDVTIEANLEFSKL